MSKVSGWALMEICLTRSYHLKADDTHWFFSKVRGWSVGLKDCVHAKLLRDLGFPLPVKQPRLNNLKPSSILLQRASSRYEVFCSNTLGRGGAGKTVKLELDLNNFTSSSELAVAKMSSASNIKSLRDALHESPMAIPFTGSCEVKIATLPLLPSDCLARLGVSKRTLCQVKLEGQKRRRTNEEDCA